MGSEVSKQHCTMDTKTNIKQSFYQIENGKSMRRQEDKQSFQTIKIKKIQKGENYQCRSILQPFFISESHRASFIEWKEHQKEAIETFNGSLRKRKMKRNRKYSHARRTQVPFFDDGKCEICAAISILQCFSMSCIRAAVRGKNANSTITTTT